MNQINHSYLAGFFKANFKHTNLTSCFKQALLIPCLLLIGMSVFSQTLCETFRPCREFEGAIFPGGSTLCELSSSFDADYTIADGKFASQLHLTLWPLGSDFTSKDILIEGIFYIDIPTAFYNCRVKLASGAKIIVTSESYLNELLVFQSKFFSCDEMWKGIELEEGIRCRLYSSKFEDAQYCISVDENVSLSLYGNTFNRNFVSITNMAGTHTLPFLLFKNNTFNCTSELSDFYDLDFACCLEDPVSFAGVLLNNCVSTIGAFGARNRFHNLNYGIVAANNSSIYIKGCEFKYAQMETIIPDLLQEEPLMGCGIAGINSRIFVIGDSENVSSSFEYADILTHSSDLHVTFANFIDSRINADESYSGEIVGIRDNKLTGTLRTSNIFVRRSMSSGDGIHTWIERNTIKNHSPISALEQSFGIHINGFFHPTDFALINENVIETSGILNFQGIVYTIGSSENTLIFDNNIELGVYSQFISGIYALLGDSKGSKINNNTIYGDVGGFDVFHELYGINALVATGIEYCGNNIDKLSYGMAFRGNCDRSLISQNDLDELMLGLYLSDVLPAGFPGVFGQQMGTRNSWLNDGDLYIPHSAENASSADLFFSQYLLTSTDYSNPTYNPDNVEPDMDAWFAPFFGGNNLCTIIPQPISPFDSIIILSSLYFENLSDPSRFYLTKTLINKILQNSLSATYSTFLSSMFNESEYQLAYAEVGMKKAMQMDLTAQDDLDDLDSLIFELYSEIEPYDGYNYSHIDSTTSFTEGLHLDSIQVKLSRIHLAQTASSVIRSSRMTTLISDLQDIANHLDTIATRNTYDADYKTIYSLFIQKIVSNDLTGSDYDDLNAIALNTIDSSFANITATALFKLCSNEKGYPEYSFICEEEEPYASPESSLNQNMSIPEVSVIKIADGILINSMPAFSGNLAIFDISGKMIISKPISEGELLQLPYNLVPGIYYYYISDNTHTLLNSGLLPIYK